MVDNCFEPNAQSFLAWAQHHVDEVLHNRALLADCPAQNLRAWFQHVAHFHEARAMANMHGHLELARFIADLHGVGWWPRD